jgi:hypothetical protein
MLPDELRALYQAQDFQPFQITLRGGRTFNIATRDHIWVSPLGIVHLVEGTDLHRIFDPNRIEFVHYNEKRSNGKTGPENH